MLNTSVLPAGPPPASEESIFRSAPMSLVQFYVTIELARDLVYMLGKLGNVHFRDLNSKLTPFQRTFINELRAIDGVESHLRYLYSVMLKYDTIKGDVYLNLKADLNPLPSTSAMDDIKLKVSEFYERISHLDASFNELQEKALSYLENRYVINALNEFHTSTLIADEDDRHHSNHNDFEIGDDDDDDDVALLNNQNHGLELGDQEVVNFEDSGFNSISGTLARDKIPLLRKLLWRTLRGNLYFHDIPITAQKLSDFNSKNPELIDKNVFIIYIHGDVLKTRVRKIIQSLDGRIYNNVDGGSSARFATLNELNYKLEDLNSIVESTKDHLITDLLLFQENYADYLYMIQREKLIHETLNKFDEDSTRRCLVGEGWIPTSQFEEIRRTMKNLVRDKTRQSLPLVEDSEDPTLTIDSGTSPFTPSPNTLFSIDDTDGTNQDDDNDFSLIAVVNELATNRTPPTFHKTNKFTAAFQAIIDAYGIATYQEVNPGLATIITFPFMFAIMFGDVGHGFIVMLMGLYLIRNERKFDAMRNKDEIFEMAFGGRYIILLMGLFSMYTGLIYNDIFSKTLTLFKSRWIWEYPKNYDFAKDGAISLVATKANGTYPFGLDWAWHGAENNLLFTNSYKMKLSILMGFVHMNYSLMFSLVNYRFFKSRVDIIGNFIPGFLFMESIFGYLSLTILYKWSVDWFGKNRQPPGLLNMLINMFLAPGKIEDQLYPGQKFIQIVLVLIALCCVPWLLLYKPMKLRAENNKAIQLGYSDVNSQTHHQIQLHEEEEALNNDPPDSDLDSFTFPNDIEPLHHNSAAHGDEDGGFNLGDVVIHQVIHTIEFCLNCVSHTASYLRLWALSLAHAQLSSVLWSMTIQNAFGTYGAKGIVMTVLLFGLWFVLTVCILVLMEGTSAMLHSLRLHWVEAMSKFFEGEGYAYEPFNFNSIN